ncbi:MAG: HlyD family efflux transporter periplasmic adaptor subunit [Acidobacteriota bacterium]|nr:HlyD family efflux transporter periplasmic adaptor subunit [Acidobacteriota bacterium]
MRISLQLALLLILASLLPSSLAADGPAPVLLTGRLEAARGERLMAPITSVWNLQLKWIVEEGVAVDEGEAIARFDSAGIADQLLDVENELITKQQQRAVQVADGKLRRLELELAHVRAQAEFKKASLDASVPEGILEGKDFRERQLEEMRKRKALDDALLALSTHESTQSAALSGLDFEVGRLSRSKKDLDEELEKLVLRATRTGIVVHEDHPWYGRKVRIGDRVQATFPVASIPDLATLEVDAWGSEVDAWRLAPGQPVELTLDAFPSRRLTGRVVEIGSAGERREQWGREPYFHVRIALDEVDVDVMKPGMSVRCVVDTAAPSALADAGGP